LNIICSEGLLTAAALKNKPSALPLQKLKSGSGDYSTVLSLCQPKAFSQWGRDLRSSRKQSERP